MVLPYTKCLSHLRTKAFRYKHPSSLPSRSIGTELSPVNCSFPSHEHRSINDGPHFRSAELNWLPKSHTRSCTTPRAAHARQVFDGMPERDYKSCNATIRSFAADHQYQNAISVFNWMHSAKIKPDCFSFAAVIKSSAAVPGMGMGHSLHGFAVKEGYSMDLAVQKALMDMYARFSALHDSVRIFQSMAWRDPVAWNVLLTGYARFQLHVEALELFCSMHASDDEDVKLTAITVAVILPICAKSRLLKLGRSVHGCTIKLGLEQEVLVGNALVSMYAKCGFAMDDARDVFHLIPVKDVVSWNSIIAGYSENGFYAEAFELFMQMVSMGFLPNHATVANVLSVCIFVENAWFYGKEIHCYVLRLALQDLSVSNALLSCYSKVGDMKGAESVFEMMRSRDIVTWNSMIAGYTLNGWLLRALDLYHHIFLCGMKPDSVTLISMLTVCAQLHDVKEGKKIHKYICQQSAFHQEISLRNALINFYGKCGELHDAFRIFECAQKKDVISWNAMLTAYADNGQWEKLIELLNQMIREGVQPDNVTVLIILQVCALLGIRRVMEVHGYSLRAGFISKANVGNTVLNAYAECGSIENAFRTFKSLTSKNAITSNVMISGCLKHGYEEAAEAIFKEMDEKDLTTWNLMIQVYAQSDCIQQAINLFCELPDEGRKPDKVTIMSILPACVRLASAHLVRQCHGYTIRDSISDIHIDGALVDAYSKCGSINYALKLFQSSLHKDLISFSSMIGGFAMHGMAEQALDIFSQMINLGIKPDHVIITSLLSACSHAGLIDEGFKHFRAISLIHGMEPTMEHYACMVDLLARAGQLREAYNFIRDMPCKASANNWGTLLGACKVHREVEIGWLAANQLFDIEAENIGNYVLMSNIFAEVGRWDGVEQVRRLMRSKDLRKPAGCSWVDIERTSHVFVATDLHHPRRPFIYDMLRFLDQQVKEPLIQESGKVANN